MMLEFDLIIDNDDIRKYKVTSNHDVGFIVVNKTTHKAITDGKFSSMFSLNFIIKLVTGTLNLTKPPLHFVYGVG